MRPNRKTFFISVLVLLATAGRLFAADATATQPPAANNGMPYNMTLISLVSMVLILLFVIGVLAGTLRQLGFVVHEKIRREKKDGSTVAKASVIGILLLTQAVNLFAAGDTPVAAAHMIDGIPASDFYLIAGVLILELVVIFALLIYINILVRIVRNTPERVAAKAVAPKHSWFWDKFNDAVSIEKEKDILLDHNYDGIRELDNSLPPWWKYGFYLTILVGVVYVYRFHFSHDGMSQEEEFVAEMQKGEADKAAYLAHAANNVDENNVVLLTDGGEIAAGKELFTKNCAACHVADGGGNVGPNLTDDYWLHGGGIKDVFKSIKYGWQDKGMKSWKDDFSPKQLQQLASFVKSLKGSKPASPKAPQGELFIEAKPVNTPVDSAHNNATAKN